MARTEEVILTTMCMVTDGKGNVLVQDKCSPSWPGMTYPGGHVEPGESITDSVVREVREETGLTVHDPKLCGVKQFYKLDGTRYIVFLYKASRYSGELRPSEEGNVFWIPMTDFEKYTWVPDFADMRRVFEEDNISEVCYYRENGELKRKFL